METMMSGNYSVRLRRWWRQFPPALEHRASQIVANRKDLELADKLIKAADVMRDSGNMYVTWARHYAGLSAGTSGDLEEVEGGSMDK
jgi:hypothetical protein